MKLIFILLLAIVISGCGENLENCKKIRALSYYRDAIDGAHRGFFTDVSYKCADGKFKTETIRGTFELDDFNVNV